MDILIGENIKKLRKQKDLTQEQLAEILGVSNAAVSKWERGETYPDISLLPVIARYFSVSVDEILGYDLSKQDKRKKELLEAHKNTFITGDITERIKVSETGVKEFPDNIEFLCNYAWACWCYACGYITNDDEFSAERARVCEAFRKVIENSNDTEIKCSGISGIVQCLNGMGNKTEALKYAKMYPDTRVSYIEREELIAKCLEGEEKQKKKQEILIDRIDDLIRCLTFDIRSIEAISTARQILDIIIPDGNYLHFHYYLMSIEIHNAKTFIESGDCDKAIHALLKAKYHAQELDKIEYENPGKYKYSSSLLSLYECDTTQYCRTGTETYIDDFYKWLDNKLYDPIREMSEFQNLYMK